MKSSLELEPVVKGLKEVRDNARVGGVLRHETDNINVDGKLWRDSGGVLGDAKAIKPATASNLWQQYQPILILILILLVVFDNGLWPRAAHLINISNVYSLDWIQNGTSTMVPKKSHG